MTNSEIPAFNTDAIAALNNLLSRTPAGTMRRRLDHYFKRVLGESIASGKMLYNNEYDMMVALITFFQELEDAFDANYQPDNGEEDVQ